MDSDRSYYRYVSDLIEQMRPNLPPANRAVRAWNWARIKRVAVLVALSLCLLGAVIYVGDYAVVRYRLARGGGLGTVTVVRLYAIPQKSGKTEFQGGGAELRTCLRSLYPHFGYSPCWYVNRHRDERTNF